MNRNLVTARSARFLLIAVLTPVLHDAQALAEEKPSEKDTPGLTPKEGEASKLPAVFDKPIPESLDDLRAMQDHVRSLLPRLRACTVVVEVRGGPAGVLFVGCGVIVSADGYVLTAGYVSGKPGRDVTIVFEDGKTATGKTLGRNGDIDGGLIKITEEGPWPCVAMGKSSAVNKGDWCFTLGHPGGIKPGRAAVLRVGRILDKTRTVLRSDCALVGGDNGGPLFDVHGRVIGVNSRIGVRITDNMHVPVDTCRETWDHLVKGEEWGVGIFAAKVADVYMGVVLDFDNGKIKIVSPDSPAEKAGLKVDDVITQVDGKKIPNQNELNDILMNHKANDEITLEVLRDENSLSIKLKLEKRPSGL